MRKLREVLVMASAWAMFSIVVILLMSVVMFSVDMAAEVLMMKSVGTWFSSWSSACLATVSAPMLTPAKNVAASTTPSNRAMYSCHDRIRCLAT